MAEACNLLNPESIYKHINSNFALTSSFIALIEGWISISDISYKRQWCGWKSGDFSEMDMYLDYYIHFQFYDGMEHSR